MVLLAFGFVVRDDEGKVLMAGSKRCDASGSSTLAEALALKFRITTTLEAGLGGIQVESDSELLIRTIRGNTRRRPISWPLLKTSGAWQTLFSATTSCSLGEMRKR
ncbi:hypothetical protein ACS0TY_014008 [Phlomoides rotata]